MPADGHLYGRAAAHGHIGVASVTRRFTIVGASGCGNN
jgi:hypothetical protein